MVCEHMRLTAPCREMFRASASHYTGRPARRQPAVALPRCPAAPASPAHAPQPGPFWRLLPHTHGLQAVRIYDRAALNLAGLCEMVPYKHGVTLAGDSISGWCWHGGEGWVVWGQQLEFLSVIDPDTYCPYAVHGCLQAALAVMLKARAVDHRPESGSSRGTATTPARPWSRELAAGNPNRQAVPRRLGSVRHHPVPSRNFRCSDREMVQSRDPFAG